MKAKPRYFNSTADALSGSGIFTFANIISGFPYAERYCPYCERLLEVANAIHFKDQEEIYKAILICNYTDCGAYDEEAKKAYVRVYYSCEKALELYETTFLRFQREEKN